VTTTSTALRPQVARQVAARLLRRAAPDQEPVPYEVDWAGPVRAELTDERSVQAVCGIMHVHGRATGGPLPLAVDYASVVAGALAAQGATAVLLARARGLALSTVRTSVAQGALVALTQYLAAATALHPDGAEPPERPGTATLVSADGVRVEIETLDPDAWRDFWTRLGLPPGTAGRGWRPFQQRFATAVCPLPSALRATAAGTPSTVLRAVAEATGVSLLVVGDDPAPITGPEPWTLHPTAPAPRSPRTRPAGGTATAPLHGLRVVESTRRVQGPLAGHLLRLLGAEVVRIEQPGGDPMRWLPPMVGECSARFAALNAGKRVVEADFTTPAGRATVRELAADADVFLHNWAPGRAERLGLDAPALTADLPGLVHAWASGFGSALGDRPVLGTDYLAQVHDGLAAAVRPAGTPPAPSLMTLTDVLGGLVCAQGVLAALLARERTGRGARVESSLASAAALVPRPARRARWTPRDLPLPTADGHVYLGREARSRPGGLPHLPAPGHTLTSAELVAHLASSGLSAVPVRTDLATLPQDPDFRSAVLPAEPDARPPVPARPAAPWEFA
jgi:crotonobetainyl-CoA:carnitine CoA-transferase CaiB-like acyl-CoA transferase